MAASSEADATAGTAVRIVKSYQSEHVGQDRANSSKPLARAIQRRDNAAQAVERARREHHSYLELSEEGAAREKELRQAEVRLRLFRLACDQLGAEQEAQGLRRAEHIVAKYPHGVPTGLSRDSGLANE